MLKPRCRTPRLSPNCSIACWRTRSTNHGATATFTWPTDWFRSREGLLLAAPSFELSLRPPSHRGRGSRRCCASLGCADGSTVSGPEQTDQQRRLVRVQLRHSSVEVHVRGGLDGSVRAAPEVHDVQVPLENVALVVRLLELDRQDALFGFAPQRPVRVQVAVLDQLLRDRAAPLQRVTAHVVPQGAQGPAWINAVMIEEGAIFGRHQGVDHNRRDLVELHRFAQAVLFERRQGTALGVEHHRRLHRRQVARQLHREPQRQEREQSQQRQRAEPADRPPRPPPVMTDALAPRARSRFVVRRFDGVCRHGRGRLAHVAPFPRPPAFDTLRGKTATACGDHRA